MIISISGKIYAGKDQVAQFIQELLPNGKWEIKKYAGKLKQICSILLNVPVEQFEDRKYKDTYLPKEYDCYRCRFTGKHGTDQFGPDFLTRAEAVAYEANERRALQWPKSLKTVIKKERMKVREFMQKLGTEGLRNGLHQNIWVNSLYADYVYQHNPTESVLNRGLREGDAEWQKGRLPNWIITDTRFPNELKAAKLHKGICVKITRKETDAKAGNHLSEVALDDVKKWDAIITNDGTLEDLKEQVRQFLIKKGLLEE